MFDASFGGSLLAYGVDCGSTQLGMWLMSASDGVMDTLIDLKLVLAAAYVDLDTS